MIYLIHFFFQLWDVLAFRLQCRGYISIENWEIVSSRVWKKKKRKSKDNEFRPLWSARHALKLLQKKHFFLFVTNIISHFNIHSVSYWLLENNINLHNPFSCQRSFNLKSYFDARCLSCSFLIKMHQNKTSLRFFMWRERSWSLFPQKQATNLPLAPVLIQPDLSDHN